MTAPAIHHRLRAVDQLVLGYIAVSSVVAAARVGIFPDCGWLLIANALIAALVLLLTHRGLGRLGRVVREVYPLLLLVMLYGALGILNGSGRVPVHDAAVQRWEAAIFGSQPSRDWWQAMPSRFWSTLFHGAYLSYYLIVAVPAIVLLTRGDLSGLRRFVLAVMTTFITCYLAFLFFPVAGPYYAFARPTGPFVDNVMARLVYSTLARGSSYGAAFPSSHIAASVAATLAAGRASRPLGLALLVPTVLLTVAVVYCQMHYAVDAIAGLAVGALIAGLVVRAPISA